MAEVTVAFDNSRRLLAVDADEVQLTRRVYRDGKERPWPLGRGVKRVRLSSREVWAAPAPICDLDAAFRTTQIPNVTAYYAVPSRLATLQPFVFPSRLQRQGWSHDGYSHPLILLAGLRARPSPPPRPRAGPIN